MGTKLKTIIFDADDTLWENEIFFRESEKKFCKLLGDFAPPHKVIETLLESEMSTLNIYGYGIKGFVLCMIRTALQLCGEGLTATMTREIIEIGNRQLKHPVKVYDGVKETLEFLHGRYDLLLATKGDPTDQNRKIEASGLQHYFSHIEIMPDKKIDNYKSLANRTGIEIKTTAMVGNSLRSDILPVLELGGYGIYIPCQETWAHEIAEKPAKSNRFFELDSIKELIKVI
ncbi:HAD family hydrolase [Coprobacter tertius]|uniref:HAD family hydrolase n=1 Tax=Coprobacter tertius TaxID=2944915 RepID=A0ABT1MFG4_9BACT|nr:HAD family hydrolase [Coprobacter tertius]MCP9610616.1 HAD family hydrolase [Coprobacter tertius]